MYELKRIRSAKAPVISAGVIMANFNWYMAKSSSGIVGAILNVALPNVSRIIKNVAGLPMMPCMDSPNTKLKPKNIQITVIMAIQIKL